MSSNPEHSPDSGRELLEATYLPFTREEVARHFENPEHLSYYLTSVQNYRRFRSDHPKTVGMKITNEVRSGRQTEKDERFWTFTALKHVFDAGRMPDLLRRGFGERPPPPMGIGGWDEFCRTAEAGQLRLLFEVDLPAPRLYRNELAKAYQAGSGPTLIPYVRDAGRGSTTYEGPTQVDAVLLNEENGCTVLFEAKVMSDISGQVTFDMTRNQLIRNIDVMLEESRQKLPARNPDRTLFALLTPRAFRNQHRHARLYGWLYDEYKKRPAALQEHLPHRPGLNVEAVSQRIGWIAYEDCNDVWPGACPWL